MSVTALLVPLAIALIAMLVWTAITGSWSVRPMVAMFFYALCILLLPVVIHA